VYHRHTTIHYMELVQWRSILNQYIWLLVTVAASNSNLHFPMALKIRDDVIALCAVAVEPLWHRYIWKIWKLSKG